MEEDTAHISRTLGLSIIFPDAVKGPEARKSESRCSPRRWSPCVSTGNPSAGGGAPQAHGAPPGRAGAWRRSDPRPPDLRLLLWETSWSVTLLNSSGLTSATLDVLRGLSRCPSGSGVQPPHVDHPPPPPFCFCPWCVCDLSSCEPLSGGGRWHRASLPGLPAGISPELGFQDYLKELLNRSQEKWGYSRDSPRTVAGHTFSLQTTETTTRCVPV